MRIPPENLTEPAVRASSTLCHTLRPYIVAFHIPTPFLPIGVTYDRVRLRHRVAWLSLSHGYLTFSLIWVLYVPSTKVQRIKPDVRAWDGDRYDRVYKRKKIAD